MSAIVDRAPLANRPVWTGTRPTGHEVAFHEAADAPEPGTAARRVLVVHAHPDDESSKGAGTTARLADEGAAVVLVTLTDGAAGEVLNPGCDPVEQADMVAVREQELLTAVTILGYSRTFQLGYPDSGWHEDKSNVPDEAFWNVPIDDVAAEIADIIRRERPHVVVTYPPDGGYPHPDHIRCHQVSMRAIELAADDWAVPRTVSSNVFTRQKLLAMHAAHVAAGLTSHYADWLVHRRPPAALDIRLDVGEWFRRRDEALLAHVTQIDPDGRWFALSRQIEASVFPFECFAVEAGLPVTDAPADDLFVGIDLD